MISRYLDKEITISQQQMVSHGEVVNIIPHDVLEDLLLNSEFTHELNISVHYTPIPANEPRHYIFLCAISDKTGRRIESIGESLDETLDTEIARNYPALMAFKRAFDAAAIAYLGLDGKVYSDQQCSTAEPCQPASDTQYSAFPPEEDEGPINYGAGPEQPADADETPAAEPVSAAPDDGPTAVSEQPADSPAAETKKRGRKPATQKTTQNPPAFFSAEPVDEDVPTDNPDEAPATETISFGAAPDDADEGEVSSPAPSTEFGAAPPDEEYESEDENSGDEFDILIDIGKLKNHPKKLRDAYDNVVTRSTLYWIANTFKAFSDHDKRIQAACAKYIQMMEGQNGKK